MTELERSLKQVFEEHRHESGLHIIGGQQRLIDRLVQFFEDGLKWEGRDKSSMMPKTRMTATAKAKRITRLLAEVTC